MNQTVPVPQTPASRASKNQQEAVLSNGTTFSPANTQDSQRVIDWVESLPSGLDRDIALAGLVPMVARVNRNIAQTYRCDHRQEIEAECKTSPPP